MQYFRSRNDKDIDFVTRTGSKVERLIQVCYDMTSVKTRKRELDTYIGLANQQVPTTIKFRRVANHS